MDVNAATEAFVRNQSAPLVGTQSAALAIQRVKYSHDAFIDLIIAQPGIKQGEIAKHFGYSQTWVSRVMNSDAFLARLAERKKDLVDPAIGLSIDEKLRAVASISLDKVLEKLELAPTMDDALRAMDLSAKALGYGARTANLNVQTNFVVALPAQAQNAQAWAEKYTTLPPGLKKMQEAVEEATVRSDPDVAS